MSDYGLQVWDASPKLVYDSTSVTWNQVGFFTALADQTVVKDYPAAGGLELITMQFMVNDLPSDQEALSHDVVISGTQVTASGGNQTTVVLVLGR